MAWMPHVQRGAATPTISLMRLRSGLAVLPLVLVPLVACAPQDDSSGSAAEEETTSAVPSDTGTASTEPSESATEAGSLMSPECTGALKKAGQLTVGTDSPA